MGVVLYKVQYGTVVFTAITEFQAQIIKMLTICIVTQVCKQSDLLNFAI
jgi:hypothetical protein